MTDRAINFREIVDGLRDSTDSNAGSATIVPVTGTDLLDVCQRLFRSLEDHTDRSTCEFYMSHNARRELERQLVESGPDVAGEDFLERQIRTDVSMPDETILFMHPDAVTLGGTVTGSSSIGLGTISSDAGGQQ